MHTRTKKFKDESNRMPSWDYGKNGYYFVTICTHDRIRYFGYINNGNIRLSKIGRIIQQYWSDIPNHFHGIILDEFVIMPDHIHGIVIIQRDNDAYRSSCGKNASSSPHVCRSCHGRDAINRVPTQCVDDRNSVGGATGVYNPMLRQTLGTVIRWFKGRVSYECHQRHFDFQWQPRYHDRIIRDENAYRNIKWYIQNNPTEWQRTHNHH